MKITLTQPDDPWTPEHAAEYKKYANRHADGCGTKYRGCAPGCFQGMFARQYQLGVEDGKADILSDIKEDIGRLLNDY